MDITKGKITMQQEHQQGFEVTDKPSTDITSEQWFWDMAVIS